jgi:5-methyltetrahydrofolate--homocysteine methyltransferase
MDEMHPLSQAVIGGNRTLTAELTRRCLAEGEDPGWIIENRLVPAMAVVGERFKCDEIFVPEMLISANAMKEALGILEPLLASAGVAAAHTAVIGTVEGDLHDIGKNLVGMMWKGANIDVIDLGVNVSASAFVEAVVDHRPEIVGMSALLTTTIPRMRNAIAAVKGSGVPVKIIIGGAPVTADFAAEAEADGFAEDAASAVDVALELMGAGRAQPGATTP